MKFRTVVIYSLIALFLAGVFLQAQAPLEIRAASSTAVAGWQQMSTPAGGTLWVSPSNALTLSDVAQAEPRTGADGQRTVGMTFTAEGSRKMAQLSAAQIDKPIALLVDGKVVWAPIVRAVIAKEATLGGVTPEVVARVLAAIKQ
jgi:preprotein translocase subunit SecD